MLQLTAGHLLSLPVPSLCAISQITPVYKRVGKLFLGIPMGSISTLLQVTPRLGPKTLTTPAVPLCIAASASQCAYSTISLKRVSCQCACSSVYACTSNEQNSAPRSRENRLFVVKFFRSILQANLVIQSERMSHLKYPFNDKRPAVALRALNRSL